MKREGMEKIVKYLEHADGYRWKQPGRPFISRRERTSDDKKVKAGQLINWSSGPGVPYAFLP